MKRVAALAVALGLLATLPADAHEAEAKQAAQEASCKPTKLEVLKQVTGRLAQTLYKVSCGNQKDGFVLVQCHDRSCNVTR